MWPQMSYLRYSDPCALRFRILLCVHASTEDSRSPLRFRWTSGESVSPRGTAPALAFKNCLSFPRISTCCGIAYTMSLGSTNWRGLEGKTTKHGLSLAPRLVMRSSNRSLRCASSLELRSAAEPCRRALLWSYCPLFCIAHGKNTLRDLCMAQERLLVFLMQSIEFRGKEHLIW